MEMHIKLDKGYQTTQALQLLAGFRYAMKPQDTVRITFPEDHWTNGVVLENALPIHAVHQEGLEARWKFALPDAVTVMQCAHKQEAMLLMGCSYGPEFVDKAVSSINLDGTELVLLDALPDNFDWLVYPWSKKATILRLPWQYKFTNIMNVAFTYGLLHNYNHIGFMHADAEANDRELWHKLLALAKAKYHENCGITYTTYDVLCIFDARAVRTIGFWDESFMQYYADNDYYRRLRLGGWREMDTPLKAITHYGSYTLKLSDRKGRELIAAQDYSVKHYEHKWGKRGQEHQMTPYGLE